MSSRRSVIWNRYLVYEESVAYDLAIEAINGTVGAYTARIAAEDSKPSPIRRS